MNPLHLHFLSNAPWVSSGYGVQTKLNMSALNDAGIAVSCTANHGLQGGVVNIPCARVYPSGYAINCSDIIVANATHAGADAVVMLGDAWAMPISEVSEHLYSMSWFPVDTEPLAIQTKAAIEKAKMRIAYSRFGQRMVQDAGLDCEYIPLSFDSASYTPGNKADAREKLSIPGDKFVCVIVAQNKGPFTHKSFYEQIKAFKLFYDRHRDAFLYIHSDPGENTPGTANLLELLRYLEIAECSKFTNRHALHLGLAPSVMADIYRSADLLLSVSRAEGFGVPIIEAQACGTPVITGDWTAMSELTHYGMSLPREYATMTWNELGGYRYTPDPHGIRDAIEYMFECGRSQDVFERVRPQIMEYDISNIVKKYWTPIISKIIERVGHNG